MKKAKIVFGLCFGLATCLTSTSPASATSSFASGRAVIDWSSLQVQSYGLELIWNDGNGYGVMSQGSSSKAAVVSAWQSDWAGLSYGQKNMFDQTAGYARSSARVRASGAGLNVASARTDSRKILSRSAVINDDGRFDYAAAEAKRWGEFYVASGTGTVTISFNYDLSVNIHGSPNSYEYGSSSAWGNLSQYTRQSDGDWLSNGIIADTIVLRQLNDSKNWDRNSGTIDLSYQFTPGSFGYLEVGTMSKAAICNFADETPPLPVPLPGALLILSAGLLGLTAIYSKN